MKRYKIELFAVSPIAAGRPFAGYSTPIVDHFEPKIYEHPEGEWVKWKDVKDAVTAFNDWVDRGIWPVDRGAACNFVPKTL